jgi:hypothetical protein
MNPPVDEREEQARASRAVADLAEREERVVIDALEQLVDEHGGG